MIAAITEKKKFSDHMETTLTAIAGEWFHMIAMITAITEFFFLSDHSDGSDHMETGL